MGVYIIKNGRKCTTWSEEKESMPLELALDIIAGRPNTRRGYIVRYYNTHTKSWGHFPEVERDDPAIVSKEEAWELARQFAAGNQDYYTNIEVWEVVNEVRYKLEGEENRIIGNMSKAYEERLHLEAASEIAGNRCVIAGIVVVFIIIICYWKKIKD